jgi:hypothetical protein
VAEAIVFAGPSLWGFDRSRAPGIEFRPPAGCGDIARAVDEGPRVIGLIDGLFETSAAPWHKEILWTMAQGVAVFGAASMGALRAVELEAYGMHGSGWVFDAFRTGALEDDDEVAVLHGPAETGFVPVSDAMVNIRATMAAALRAGVLESAEAETLVRMAKRTFYKERSWSTLLSDAGASGLACVSGLSDWLRTERQDVKHADAAQLVEKFATLDRLPREAHPDFPATRHWQRFFEKYVRVDLKR